MGVPYKNESKKVVIECDCGTHLLKVQSEVYYSHDTLSKKSNIRQEYHLAMFYYGIDSDKHKWWDRIKIALKYIWTGKIYSDQLSLSNDEALKLYTFIKETLIEK